MPIINITSLDHEGVSVFATLTEAQLRNRKDEAAGIFIAESPKVIRVALDAGYEPLALLCERRHISGDAKDTCSRAACSAPCAARPSHASVRCAAGRGAWW